MTDMTPEEFLAWARHKPFGDPFPKTQTVTFLVPLLGVSRTNIFTWISGKVNPSKTSLLLMEALKRVEAGLSVPEICRELGISSATFYKWRAKFGGMDVPMIARLKELEAENSRLKKMYAEERLKAEILNEALTKKW